MKNLMKHHSKRWWVSVGVGVAVAIILVTYAVYSLVSWHSYQARTEAWKSTTKQTLDAALSLKSSTDEQRKQKITALQTAVTEIRSSQLRVCTPARVTGWQLMFDGPRRARDTCGTYVDKVKPVAEQVNHVTMYLESESRLTDALRPALAFPGTVSEANWQQIATAWSQVHMNVTNLTVSSEFSLTKQQAVSVTSALDVQWKDLMASHAAKDKVSFVAATAKLQESYAALAGISTINDSQLTVLTARLQKLYLAL